jgi:hypothetical protein
MMTIITNKMSGLTDQDFQVLLRLTTCLRENYWEDFYGHEDEMPSPPLCTVREARDALNTLRQDGIYVMFGGFSTGELIRIVQSYIANEFTYGRTELGDSTFKRDGDVIAFSQPMRIVLTRRGREFVANRKALFAEIQSLRKE